MPTGTAAMATKVALPVTAVVLGRTTDAKTELVPATSPIAAPRLSCPLEMATWVGLPLDHRACCGTATPGGPVGWEGTMVSAPSAADGTVAEALACPPSKVTVTSVDPGW